ncbi:MAG: hypothetical protein ABIQ44_05240 [Chloroflexia bacterium]
MDTWDSWGALEEKAPPEFVLVGDTEVRPGDHVILRPNGRSDVFDIALAGMNATIESIMQDYEDRIYVVVTVDDDPGREFGLARKPGHRFFFSTFEIEPIPNNGGEA